MGKEIGHIEMTSKDLMQTKKFYSRLFGWKFELFGDKYMMFRTSKNGVGGGFQLGKKPKQGTTTLYVNVDTIPATQQKAKGLGGRILKKRKSIGGGMGYWGTIGDPHGNVIGLWSKKEPSNVHPRSWERASLARSIKLPFFISSRPFSKGTKAYRKPILLLFFLSPDRGRTLGIDSATSISQPRSHSPSSMPLRERSSPGPGLCPAGGGRAGALS